MKRLFLVLGVLVLLAGPVFAADVYVQGINNNTAFNETTIITAAASGAGAGSTYVLPKAMSRFTWVVTYSGSPAGVSVTLDGSNDNSNWFTLDTTTTAAGEMRHIVNKTVKYIRGNVGTLSGGSSPKATVKVLGAYY